VSCINVEQPELQKCVISISNLYALRLSPFRSIPSKQSPGVKMRGRHLLRCFDTVLFSCSSSSLMTRQLPCPCSNRLPGCPGPPGIITCTTSQATFWTILRPLRIDSSVCGSVSESADPYFCLLSIMWQIIVAICNKQGLFFLPRPDTFWGPNYSLSNRKQETCVTE
jgi:hypothetical protein